MVNKYSSDLKVGDIVLVEKNSQFPADLIIISSSQEDGLAYIETAELDGFDLSIFFLN